MGVREKVWMPGGGKYASARRISPSRMRWNLPRLLAALAVPVPITSGADIPLAAGG